MLLFAAAMVATVASSLWWPLLPASGWALLALPLLMLALWRHWTWLAGIALGLVLTLVQLNHFHRQQVSEDLTGGDHITELQVLALPQASRWGWQFEADVRLRDQPWRGRLLVHWNGAERPPQPGEYWRFCLRLKPATGLVNPASPDRRQYWVSRGLHGSASVSRCVAPARLAGRPSLRSQLAQRLMQHELEQGPLLMALVVGVRDGIDADLQRLFQHSGTAHLLAISGLHVVMLFSALVLLAGRRRPRQPMIFVALLVVAGYVWLAGGAVPAQRALLMLVLVALLHLGRWRLSGGQQLALAVTLIVALDVKVVYGLSLWLSAGAVGAILIGLRLWPHWSQWPWWRQLLLMQLWLSLTSGLLSVLFFAQASLISPLANLLLVPLFSWWVLPLALLGGLALLLSLLWPPLALAAAPLLSLADGGAGGGVWLLRQLCDQLPATLTLFWSAWQWLGVVAVIAALLVVPGWRWRMLLMGLLLALVSPIAGRPQSGWQLTVLDVGQALMVVIESGGQLMVYDVGDESRPGSSTAARVLVPWLRQRGYRQIDQLVLSHDDRDHSGGLADLQSLMPIRQLRANHLPWAQRCVAGDGWQLGEIQAEVLWPHQRDGGGSDNNRSCVVRLSGPGGRVMLMGDLERVGEAMLLASGVPLAAELLIVGHHGSNSSSHGPLLDAVQPQLALISRAAWGRWRYPHPQVEARLRQRGIAIADTGRHGALRVEFGAAAWRLMTACQQQPRWYRPCPGVE